MKRILVTGAGGSASSNFIESLRLAKEKFYIVGCDVKPHHLELADVNKRYIVPQITEKSYLTKINEIIKKERIDIIHPQPDPEVVFLSKNRDKIAAKLFLPQPKTIQICQDKMKLIQLLANAQIPVGNSYELNSEQDLKKSLNILFKKHKKVWIRATQGAGSKASLPVENFEQAKFWIKYWNDMKKIGYGKFMATEFLPGKEFAFQSLWQNGKLITSQARERIEYIFGNLTVSGQTSSPSIAKTVHREDVNEIATKTIRTVDRNATGVFCVDLKENSKGTPCVTEINAGRFFTTSNFLSHAGSNMPYCYIKLACNEPLPVLPEYNAVPANWYWVRMIDMGYKLIKNEKWRSKAI